MNSTDIRNAIYEEFNRGPADAQSAILEELLPLARTLRIVSKTETLDSIIWRMLAEDFEAPEVDPGRPEPKQMAAVAFWGLMSGLVLAADSRLFGEDDSQFMLGVIRHLPEVKGYMRAMIEVQAWRSGSGADELRARGIASKFKVWTAAQEFRGLKSKEQAAPLIAKKVNLSTGTVRRTLTQLFRGEKWKVLGSDETVDLS